MHGRQQNRRLYGREFASVPRGLGLIFRCVIRWERTLVWSMYSSSSFRHEAATEELKVFQVAHSSLDNTSDDTSTLEEILEEAIDSGGTTLKPQMHSRSSSHVVVPRLKPIHRSQLLLPQALSQPRKTSILRNHPTSLFIPFPLAHGLQATDLVTWHGVQRLPKKKKKINSRGNEREVSAFGQATYSEAFIFFMRKNMERIQMNTF